MRRTNARATLYAQRHISHHVPLLPRRCGDLRRAGYSVQLRPGLRSVLQPVARPGDAGGRRAPGRREARRWVGVALQVGDIASNIGVFVLCVPFYVLAFKKCGRECRTSLWLILVAGLILRMYAASDRCLHTWDERYHALVAKHLILHPLTPTLFEDPVLPYDFKNWTANHVWLEKGPVPLWAVSVSIRLFGTDELAVRVPSVLVSLLSVYLTYLIASLLFDRSTGILAAFFHSINGLLVELAAGRVSSDHVDTFFIFFIELGIYLSLVYMIANRRW